MPAASQHSGARGPGASEGATRRCSWQKDTVRTGQDIKLDEPRACCSRTCMPGDTAASSPCAFVCNILPLDEGLVTGAPLMMARTRAVDCAQCPCCPTDVGLLSRSSTCCAQPSRHCPAGSSLSCRCHAARWSLLVGTHMSCRRESPPTMIIPCSHGMHWQLFCSLHLCSTLSRPAAGPPVAVSNAGRRHFDACCFADLARSYSS